MFICYFRKKATELVALSRKMICELRHPMGLGHPIIIACMCNVYVKHHNT